MGRCAPHVKIYVSGSVWMYEGVTPADMRHPYFTRHRSRRHSRGPRVSPGPACREPAVTSDVYAASSHARKERWCHLQKSARVFPKSGVCANKTPNKRDGNHDAGNCFSGLVLFTAFLRPQQKPAQMKKSVLGSAKFSQKSPFVHSLEAVSGQKRAPPKNGL